MCLSVLFVWRFLHFLIRVSSFLSYFYVIIYKDVYYLVMTICTISWDHDVSKLKLIFPNNEYSNNDYKVDGEDDNGNNMYNKIKKTRIHSWVQGVLKKRPNFANHVQIVIFCVMWLLQFLSAQVLTTHRCFPHSIAWSVSWATTSEATFGRSSYGTVWGTRHVLEIRLHTWNNFCGNIWIAEASLQGGMHELYTMLQVV